MGVLKGLLSKICNFIKNLFSKKPQKYGQEYIDHTVNKITNSPNATINHNVQFGANIQVSKERPTDQKPGDFWYETIEDEKGKE